MSVTKTYTAPRSLEEIVRAAAQQDAAVMAGGTDLLPRWFKDIAPKPSTIIDLKLVPELHGVTLVDGEVRVGACTVMSELETDPVIRKAAPILSEAAGRIACSQIRNRATIGGNLCNASPAADTAVPLVVLDAVLELLRFSPDGATTREVPIASFFLAPGVTALEPGEILTRIRFKPNTGGTFTAWDKFGTRPAMEIAVASVGILLDLTDGKVAEARVAYGSVAPVPLRGHEAESVLRGATLSDDTITRCVEAARGEISPISDVRANADYRREIVGVMLRRMLDHARS